MDINFAPPQDLVELAEKTKAFVVDKVIPYEKDPRWTAHGPTDELRVELNALAKAAGVFAPHVPKEYGGRALSQIGRALVFEAAGYSILGPTAIHCASPDEGNIHLLDVVARPDQRAHFLKPLAEGKLRSCFCMTEPGGAGSDPVAAQDHGAAGRQRMGDQRHQVADHRRRQGRLGDHHGQDGGRADGRPRHSLPRRPAQPGDQDRAHARHDRFELHRRPCGDVVQRAAPAGRRGAGRDRQGLPLRPGAARAGAAQPLHALAGLGQPGAGHRHRLRPHARGVRQEARRARGRVVHAGRQR